MAYSVRGLTVDQILQMDQKSLDALKLSRSELASLTSRLASAANKRLTRLEKAGVSAQSSAYLAAQQYIGNTGGRFSVKGKSVGELKSTFKQLKQFMNPKNKTNTVRGAKESIKKVEKLVGGLPEDQKAKFFELLHKLQNNDPMMNEYRYADDDEFVNLARNGVINGTDIEELYFIMEQRLVTVYEASQGGGDATNNNSGFYPIADTSDLPFT